VDADQPDALLVVTDLETIKLASDPLRLRIVQALRGEPLTVKELARRLRQPRKGLYYHVRLLEDRGLIRVTSTRQVRGIVEKRYQAMAYQLLFDDAAFSPDSPMWAEVIRTLVGPMFDVARDELQTSIESGTVDMADNAPRFKQLLSRSSLSRLSPQQVEELYARLTNLLDDFPAIDPDATSDPSDRTYRLLIALFPTTDPSDNT
jgi:DNA-binding transcriptional ArsR family regulator